MFDYIWAIIVALVLAYILGSKYFISGRKLKLAQDVLIRIEKYNDKFYRLTVANASNENLYSVSFRRIMGSGTPANSKVFGSFLYENKQSKEIIPYWRIKSREEQMQYRELPKINIYEGENQSWLIARTPSINELHLYNNLVVSFISSIVGLGYIYQGKFNLHHPKDRDSENLETD